MLVVHRRCRLNLVGNLYDYLSTPVLDTFKHVMPLTSLIEPQHFADFGLQLVRVDQLGDCIQSVGVQFDEEKQRPDTVPCRFFLGGLGRRRNEHAAALENTKRAIECVAAGLGTSSSNVTSGGPKLCTRTAFIAFHPYTQASRGQISSRPRGVL